MVNTDTLDNGKPSIRGKIKQQKTELIQEEILLAAARLIAARGFRAVTVDDISAEMGFTKSIVYYYMKNKNEILWRIFEKIDAAYDKGLQEVLRSEGTATELLRGALRQHCLNVVANQSWSIIYNRDENELNEKQRETILASRRRYNKSLHELYARGISEGTFRDTPPVLAVCCLIGACNWPYTWFKPNFGFTMDEVADSFVELLIGGVIV